MEDRAYAHYISAWTKIKAGHLFDEDVNQAFDYMLKNLWKTQYGRIIKSDILKHFPSIYNAAKGSKTPPPVFYILISLKDNDIIKEMQSLLLLDWVKSNASEDTTFQLLNFIETFSEKGVPIENFVNTIIRNMKPTMHHDMLEALSHMITITHPSFMASFLTQFLKMSDHDDTLLKNYVSMNGRKAFLMLIKIAPPDKMSKIFKQFANT